MQRASVGGRQRRYLDGVHSKGAAAHQRKGKVQRGCVQAVCRLQAADQNKGVSDMPVPDQICQCRSRADAPRQITLGTSCAS